MKTALMALLMTYSASAQQSMFLKQEVLWVSFQQDGHIWMVGAPKWLASAHDDPGFVQTDFAKGYCIKVQEGKETVLFHDCCTTNITIGTNYTGTIQVGTNKFTVKQLMETIHRKE